jgi:enoyl-CoA hydratase
MSDVGLAGLDLSVLKALQVTTSDDGFVAEVALIGPGKGNACGPDFWREIPLVFRALDEDPTVRAVLVRGEGKNFTYGLDLAAMAPTLGGAGGQAAERTGFLDTIERMQAAMDAVESCRKPVIAAAQGWCIGAGVDLISACDIRVASADAKFSVREVKVAIVADMGSLHRLPAIIGEGMTRRLAMTGEDVDALSALAMGLVSEVHESPEELLTGARALTAQVAANPPLVVQGVKRVMNHSRDVPRREGLAYVAAWNAAFLASADLGEAFAAFVERRPASFKGQ